MQVFPGFKRLETCRGLRLEVSQGLKLRQPRAAKASHFAVGRDGETACFFFLTSVCCETGGCLCPRKMILPCQMALELGPAFASAHGPVACPLSPRSCTIATTLPYFSFSPTPLSPPNVHSQRLPLRLLRSSPSRLPCTSRVPLLAPLPPRQFDPPFLAFPPRAVTDSFGAPHEQGVQL